MNVPRLYLDHAATSFPKPPGVAESLLRFTSQLGASPGRGAYAEARTAAAQLRDTREALARLLGVSDPKRVLFTFNATDALNLAIRGLLRRGDHVVTTWMEHNSVLRPLNRLVETREIEVTRVSCDPATGLVDPEELLRAVRPTTRLLALQHGSNVTGTVQPIGAIIPKLRARGVRVLVDAAQTAGHLPIDLEALGIDLLAVPGHKGLLGPLGTGALLLGPGVEEELSTIREGGTGSLSELDVQPGFLPDRFEAGSHNALGLIALGAGLRYLEERGVAAVARQERALCAQFLAGVRPLQHVRVFGPTDPEQRVAVFSVRADGFADPLSLAEVMEDRFGILGRPGLHCAPLAHKTIGTHALGGTLRFSFGPFITEEDVDRLLSALRALR